LSISKKDLSRSLREELDLTTVESEIFVDEFFNSLKKALNTHNIVKISGFGTFKKFTTKPRIGRNPKTKEEKTISSRNVVTFKASKLLIKKINRFNA